jgi:putative membrane protein
LQNANLPSPACWLKFGELCRSLPGMPGFILRTLITMLGLWLADRLLDGVTITGSGTFVLAALLLGFVNALIRPIAVILTLPLTILTLGLFLFVINALMFSLVATLLSSFVVAGFGSALLGAIVVSLTSLIASWFIGPKGRYQVLVVNKRDH